MRRLHLVELLDFEQCPTSIRDACTDLLHKFASLADFTEPIAAKLQPVVRASGTRTVVDLCSGGGGPLPQVAAHLEAAGWPVELRLTDRFPNRASFERLSGGAPGVEFVERPVDAAAVPEDLRGLRTIFNAFHHFRPEYGVRVLADAVARRQPIALFEFVGRNPFFFASVTLNALVGVLLITPFIRPFRWSRLFWTYLVPAVPLVTLFDGWVSCLRVYSTEELRALIGALPPNDYVWDVGDLRVGPGPGVPVRYLVGAPPP